jgi:DNA anti-recombination protein RmuC
MKYISNSIATTSIILAAILVETSPAYALSLPQIPQNLLKSPLQQIVQEFKQRLSSLEFYVDDILGERLNSLSEQVQTDIFTLVEDAKGRLGIPDPGEIRLRLEELVANENPTYDVEWAATEVERQLARAQAAETFSKQGQILQEERLERIQVSVEQTQQLGMEAQQDRATQDVMKRIAAQNTELGALLGSMYADQERIHRSGDLQNLQLSNISRTLDTQNRTQTAQTLGASFQVMRTAGFGRLF